MLNKQKVLGNLREGKLFIVSAPAGTGKTTLIEMLTLKSSCIVESISFTTRAPREGEIEGKHYHFVSKEIFEKMIEDGDFLEYVTLYGDYYGTSAKLVELQRQEGKHVILIIDTQGAIQLKEKVSCILIFIQPPSIEILKNRLEGRKTETAEKVEKRLQWAIYELEMVRHYDYCLVNDDLETSLQVLYSIIVAEEHRI